MRSAEARIGKPFRVGVPDDYFFSESASRYRNRLSRGDQNLRRHGR